MFVHTIVLLTLFGGQVKTAASGIDGAQGAGGLQLGQTGHWLQAGNYTKVYFEFTYDNRTNNQNAPSNLAFAKLQYTVNGTDWVDATNGDFKSEIKAGDNQVTFNLTPEEQALIIIGFRIIADVTSSANNGALFQPTDLKLYYLI